MNPEQLEKQKEKLLALKTELETAITDESGQAGIVHLDGSMGRLSRNDALQSQQMAMALQRRQKEQLLRVENALKRIGQETCGNCLRCKGSIGEGRLDMQPEATLCATCASRPRT
jgi:DnaK suppressor protein